MDSDPEPFPLDEFSPARTIRRESIFYANSCRLLEFSDGKLRGKATGTIGKGNNRLKRPESPRLNTNYWKALASG